jgi:hypothetical protein
VIHVVYTSDVGYEWLPGVMALLRDVEPYEVMQVLLTGRRWPRPVTGPDGVSLVTVWSRTQVGRPIVVVIRNAKGLDWWIVGAREMNPAEVAEFKRWEANDEHG